MHKHLCSMEQRQHTAGARRASTSHMQRWPCARSTWRTRTAWALVMTIAMLSATTHAACATSSSRPSTQPCRAAHAGTGATMSWTADGGTPREGRHLSAANATGSDPSSDADSKSRDHNDHMPPSQTTPLTLTLTPDGTLNLPQVAANTTTTNSSDVLGPADTAAVPSNSSYPAGDSMPHPPTAPPAPPYQLVERGRPVWPWVVGLTVVAMMAALGTFLYASR